MEGKALEWITVRKETMTEKLMRILTLTLSIVSGLLGLFTFNLLFLILAVLFVAAYIFFWMNQHIEYEFCYVIGELEIAKVYNHRRRKVKYTCKIDEVEYMAKGVLKENGNQNYSYYVKGNEENVYTLVVNREGKRSNIIFEPEQAFVKELEKIYKVR